MTDEITTDRAVGRVEGKIDLILLELASVRTFRDQQHADHEHRLTALERIRWYAGGAVALALAFMAKLSYFPH